MIRLVRLALLLIAIAQFAAPVLPVLGIGENIGMRAVADGLPPELPPGVFFAIWGPIFLAYLTFALLANIRPTATSDHLAAPLAVAGLGNVIWMISAQSLAQPWLDFVLLLPILAAAWVAAYRLDLAGGFDGTLHRLLACGLVGLLAGWLSVAVSISVPDVTRWALGRDVTDRVWQSLWLTLIPAGLLASAFASRISTNLWYFVALGWGLIGVIVNNWQRTELHGLAIAATVIGVWIVLRRMRYGATGAFYSR
ncbi:MAG: hypothetical protein QNI84_12675 [Henriciella sp.]|nr:hypothetical protein [Henriciella sp.]